jgi:hypothetical protein
LAFDILAKVLCLDYGNEIQSEVLSHLLVIIDSPYSALGAIEFASGYGLAPTFGSPDYHFRSSALRNAAQRPRGEPPAVAGGIASTLRQPGRHRKCPCAARGRAGSAELLGGAQYPINIVGCLADRDISNHGAMK